MTAIKDLQSYLSRQFPATIGNIKLAEKIHNVWKYGFDDGMAMYRHGIRVFGKRQIALWEKRRGIK